MTCTDADHVRAPTVSERTPPRALGRRSGGTENASDDNSSSPCWCVVHLSAFNAAGYDRLRGRPLRAPRRVVVVRSRLVGPRPRYPPESWYRPSTCTAVDSPMGRSVFIRPDGYVSTGLRGSIQRGTYCVRCSVSRAVLESVKLKTVNLTGFAKKKQSPKLVKRSL
jgi:hypothetical protein